MTKKYIRLVAYIKPETKNELKAVLAKEDKTFSSLIRELIKLKIVNG